MQEMPPHALPGEHHGERSRQFKGIRFRKWGSWVAEIRLPRSRQKFWLGSYTTAEQAARAFDAAVYCLRGPNAVFNILDSLPSIPSASSLSRHRIQLAAAKHATLEQPPPISPSAHSNDANANASKKKRKKARKDAALPSSSASVQETVLSLRESGNQQEQELVMWESLLAESVDCLTWNSERLPSSWEEQEQQYEQHEYEDISKFTDLWNFDDVQETVLSLTVGIISKNKSWRCGIVYLRNQVIASTGIRRDCHQFGRRKNSTMKSTSATLTISQTCGTSMMFELLPELTPNIVDGLFSNELRILDAEYP